MPAATGAAAEACSRRGPSPYSTGACAPRRRTGRQREPTTHGLSDAMVDVAVMGATPALAARVDSVVDAIPFRELPMIDRPYLFAAGMLARVGKPDKARAMLARYRAEMTDTSIARLRSNEVHYVLAE